MAPPSTPSPFRFARKRDVPTRGSSSAEPRPRSSLYHKASAAESPDEPPEPAQSPVPYAVGNRSEAGTFTRPGNKPVAMPVAGLRPRSRHRDVIHDASQESEGDSNAHHYDIPFSPPKRRRISSLEPAPSALRFRTAVGAEQEEEASDPLASAKPPFILQPTTQAQAAVEPLPEAFSPHRRGRKFVPGGMAETMQGWVMEVAHGIHRASASNSEPTVSLRVTDVEHASDTFDLVRASSERVLLVRSGKDQQAGLCAGTVIHVQRPFWNMTVDDATWMIAVDWKVA